MHGAHPFVYLSALSTPKERENDKGKAKTATTNPSGADLELCPQCRKKYSRTWDVVLLNPSQDQEATKRESMERKRIFEPVKKARSSRKRKNDSPTDDAEHPVKKRGAVGPSSKIYTASQAVVSGLATDEAKRKSEMSDSVKGLYGNGTKRKKTFMNMGTKSTSSLQF